RIFDMFVRVNDPNEASCAGLGIGLALARQLATLHGGTISVHSEGLGLGSEFVLTLPIGVSGSVGTSGLATVPVLDTIEA
ncbi:MAG: ATP-binding protein, partial [Burkholderiaceae bacterium]